MHLANWRPQCKSPVGENSYCCIRKGEVNCFILMWAKTFHTLRQGGHSSTV